MREIKFRAWDGTQMIYDGYRIYPPFYSQELRDVCSPVVVTNRDVYFWIYESKLKNERDYFDHISYLPVKDIMQYTGLHDKNDVGVYMYEGDLVSLQGRLIGNKYETPELLKDKTNLLIEGIGTKTWAQTEKEGLARGLYYAE